MNIDSPIVTRRSLSDIHCRVCSWFLQYGVSETRLWGHKEEANYIYYATHVPTFSVVMVGRGCSQITIPHTFRLIGPIIRKVEGARHPCQRIKVHGTSISAAGPNMWYMRSISSSFKPQLFFFYSTTKFIGNPSLSCLNSLSTSWNNRGIVWPSFISTFSISVWIKSLRFSGP